MSFFNRARGFFDKANRFVRGKVNSAFNDPNKQKLGSFSRDVQEFRDQPFRKILGGGAPFEREGENLLISSGIGGKGVGKPAKFSENEISQMIFEGGQKKLSNVPKGFTKPAKFSENEISQMIFEGGDDAAKSLDRRPWDVIRAERLKEAEAVKKLGDDLLKSAEDVGSDILEKGISKAPIEDITKIGQTHSKSGRLLDGALNTKTVRKTDEAITEVVAKTWGLERGKKMAKWVGKHWIAIMGTYIIGEWGRADNTNFLMNTAMQDARDLGDADLVATLQAQYEEIVNPSFLTNMARAFPVSNLAVNFDAITSSIKRKFEVTKMVNEDWIAQQNGDTTDPIAKRQQDNIEMKAAADKQNNEDIAKRQQNEQEMQRVTDALKTAGINASDKQRFDNDMELLLLEQEFIEANAKERDRQMLQDHQLQMDYLQAKIDNANRNTPSQLSFGLL